MSTKRVLSIVLVASAVMLAVGIGPRFAGTARALPLAQAGVTIPYSGSLADEAGQPVADGAYDFTFALYEAESGGQALWTEAQEGVTVQDGALTALLGSVAPLPTQALDGGARWLEVAVRGPGEVEFTLLSPRQELSAAAPVAPAGLAAPAALSCAHDHLYENWAGSSTAYALQVLNSTGDGLRGVSYATAANYAGVVGNSLGGGGTGVYGLSVGGRGVYGSSESGWGVYGLSTSGTGVYGQSAAPDMSGVHGYNPNPAGGVAVSGTGGGVGVSGDTSNGIGVRGYSTSGIAILASGTGIISSTADSILYLSPHDMVAREADPSVVSLNLQDNGGVRVRNMAGASVTRYLVIPVSTFGTLFGAPLYVKAIEVCYKSATSLAFINTTGVYKNSGSDGTWSTYIEDNTSLGSTTYTCHPVNAATPRQAINNSTWVQFNMRFGGSGDGWDIYIYTVKLTLTESRN